VQPDVPVVLTIEEAGALLRIGRSAAYAAAKSGELPTIHVGRCLRVPRARLATLLGEDPENDDGPAARGAEVTTEDTRDVRSPE